MVAVRSPTRSHRSTRTESFLNDTSVNLNHILMIASMEQAVGTSSYDLLIQTCLLIQSFLPAAGVKEVLPSETCSPHLTEYI